MKMKKLTTAVALATIAVSGAASATDVSTALANANFFGSAYGSYQDLSVDYGINDNDHSDADLHAVRLGVTANVKENVVIGIELDFNPGDEADDDEDLIVRDLYAAKTYGDWTITAGRFKQAYDPEAATEQSDALFTEVYGEDSVTDDQALGGSILDSIAGMRRIEGLQGYYSNDSGIYGSVAAYKGGIDNDNGDTERNSGYSASLGIGLGDSDLAYGATISYFDEEGDSGDFVNDEEWMGYKFSSYLATGPIIAQLSYFDSEYKEDTQEDREDDGFMFYGAWNISGAQRSFNNGVLQGPSVPAGEYAYELAISYNAWEEQGPSEDEIDGFGVGLNVYCGQFVKWFLQYQTLEGEDSEAELDIFQLGARVAFN